MLSHAPALAEQAKTWKMLELWVDPVLFPPKILMLVSDASPSTATGLAVFLIRLLSISLL